MVETTATPPVVISVLNWNTPQLTSSCIRALQALDYPNFRIVVVDNNSIDDSVVVLRREFPELEVLAHAHNDGFAAGHALAVQSALASGAAAIWLVNSDALVETGALRALVAAWNSHGEGVYGGLPLHRRTHAIELEFPRKWLDPGARPSAWSRQRVLTETEYWKHAPVQPVAAVCGSSMLIPLSLVRRHGWMDPCWFMYCEELDYCFRLRDHGIGSFLVPQSRLWHAGGGSSRAHPALQDLVHYYQARNQIVLAWRHSGRVAGTLISLKKLGLACILLGFAPGRGRRLWQAVFDAARGHLGKTLAPEELLKRLQGKA